MIKRTKNTVAQKRWQDAIEPVCDFADANRGFRAALEKRLGKRFRSREKNWRVMLDLWLTRNPDRRREPLAGTGIVVLEEAEKLMANWPENNAK
jgi:hypothetical protein